MATDKRKRAIRSRMATTGEPYSQAAHAIDQDHGAGPTATVLWALLTLTAQPPRTDNETDGIGQARYRGIQETGRPKPLHRGVEDFEHADVAALALGGARLYLRPASSPVVTLFPLPDDDHRRDQRRMFAARVAFAEPGRTVDLDRVASGAAHKLLMQRGRDVSASIRPVADREVAALLAEAGPPASSPPIAERGWHTHAMVRLLREVSASSPEGGTGHYATGRVMDLWQTGRAGEPVDRSYWTTSTDIDLMHFLPADAVTVIEVLDEVPPLATDPMETAAERYARRWAPMPRLFAAARADTTMTPADWALLHDHRADLTRELVHLVRRLCRDRTRPEAGLLRIAAEVVEIIVTAERAPWAVEEARTTTAQLRALAEQLHTVDDEAVMACLARAEPTLTEALLADGTVSLDARLTPAQRRAAEPRLADRIIAAAAAGVNG
ncbi:hypothetical protein ACFV1N_25260 [Streptosporangium canum]|uniref:hypothetical protein n=1 Tax=Streptosporangium canum TaxID=324952 RepID=UPI0036AE1DEE